MIRLRRIKGDAIVRLFLIGKNRLTNFELPRIVEGSFWITNEDQENIISVEANNNQWYFINNEKYYVNDKKDVFSNFSLLEHRYYSLKSETEQYLVYVAETFDPTFQLYQISDNITLTIGSSKRDTLNYQIPYLTENAFSIKYENKEWYLKKNMKEQTLYYINNNICLQEQVKLKSGDRLFLFGFQIIFFPNFVQMNNPGGKIIHNLRSASINIEHSEYQKPKEIEIYGPEDYFIRTPRIRRFIDSAKMTVAAPPKKKEKEETPILLIIGPMLTMGITSVVTFSNLIIKLYNGTATMANSWPSLVTSIAMLTSTLLWPNITKRWRKKQDAKKEKIRQEKYNIYLEEKQRELELEIVHQKQILLENMPTLKECYNIVLEENRILWERKITQQDFLMVRLGIGEVPLDIDINFNDDEFSLEKDELKESAKKVVEESKTLKSSPVGYSFYNKNVTAIMGEERRLNSFIDNIILQLIAFHGYDNLKIVVLTNNKNATKWNYLKMLPHCFSSDKQIRFFGTSLDDYQNIDMYLSQEYINRATQEQAAQEQSVEKEKAEGEENKDTQTYLPYYLILTDDFPAIRKLNIITLLLSNKINYGFALAVKDTKLRRIPNECENFINLNNQSSAILCTSVDKNYQQDFAAEVIDDFDMEKCAEVLSNIPIEFDFESRYLPTSIGFLEMYDVGKIEQLNILNRWRINDPTQTLRAMVGVNDLSEPIYLDLHEKKHGPHGLIAGTTGSGKSEFIITYVLSLSLNFSPNEVAFILIDYKGGGLAGAFNNQKNQVYLPHLAGTITNLDKNELHRTLVSIESELKRRQMCFNEARETLGESTMDIYKYQRLFREGKLTEPIPHLFIICDEFAELKSQQPDFMDNLISTSRIGRSLGVHLILATQKPSGVVNDQIWSNSKFKICLKVQSTSDSNEMLKKPDAAMLKEAGRFYLQVGVDELYVLGQSGWAGTQYKPKILAQSEIEHRIDFVDNTFNITKSISAENKINQTTDLGDELTNVLKYITSLAAREQIKAKRLWYDNIDANIYINDLINKYNYQKPNYVEAIIGEYDDPSNQKQELFTIPLNESGNTIVYGISGMNREMYIKALLYSTSVLYSTQDINYYIFDFGSESLRIFEKLPHVGDIVFASDDEKVEKMFKLIFDEMEKRKKMFADFNGDYQTYIQYNQKVPIITLVFNNFESFKESYAKFDEDIVRLSRDGVRYGILIHITTSTQSGLYNRLLRNFTNTIVLDMNDKNDYTSILGKIGNVFPKEYEGRGLFKKELSYELQIARIYKDESNMVPFMNELSRILNERNTYEPIKIPVLPEVLTLSMLEDGPITNNNIPIGMEKDLLKGSFYNFTNQKINIIAANDIDFTKQFTRNLIVTMKKANKNVTILIDGEKFLNDLKGSVNNYCDADMNNYLNSLKRTIIEKIENKDYEMIIIINGLDKFMTKINLDTFQDFLKYIKELENVHIIFIDNTFNYKKYYFEAWYTSNVINTNGIWIGPGAMEQTIIKIVELEKKLKEKIDSKYAWVFKNGSGTLIKLIDEVNL